MLDAGDTGRQRSVHCAALFARACGMSPAESWQQPALRRIESALAETPGVLALLMGGSVASGSADLGVKDLLWGRPAPFPPMQFGSRSDTGCTEPTPGKYSTAWAQSMHVLRTEQ